MAAPTFVSAALTPGATGAVTLTLPASILTNDILLAFVETANQAVTIANQNGGTWTEVANSPQGTGTAAGASATRLTTFWSRYNGTQGNPTTSDSGDHQKGGILAIRGCPTSGNPWDVTAGDVLASASTSVTIPGVTTTVADCLMVLAVSNSTDTGTVAQTALMTNGNLTGIAERHDQNTSAGGGGGFGADTGVKAAAGATGTTATTLVTSSAQARMVIALKPSASPILAADGGSYSVSGTAVGLLLGHVLAVAAGSYALTGTAADLVRGYAVQAESGSYALTGSEATLVYTPAGNYLLAIDPGSYSLSGTDVSLEYGRVVSVASGSYAVSGTDAGLRHTGRVVVDSGSYALTGTVISLERGLLVAVASGSYSVTGTDVALVYEPNAAYVIGALAGEYAITGTDASLEYGRVVSAGSGSYALTGAAVGLVKLGVGAPIAIHRATVALPDPHSGTGAIQRIHGTSVTQGYTMALDDPEITIASSLHNLSMSPGMG